MMLTLGSSKIIVLCSRDRFSMLPPPSQATFKLLLRPFCCPHCTDHHQSFHGLTGCSCFKKQAFHQEGHYSHMSRHVEKHIFNSPEIGPLITAFLFCTDQVPQKTRHQSTVVSMIPSICGLPFPSPLKVAATPMEIQTHAHTKSQIFRDATSIFVLRSSLNIKLIV